MGARLRIGIPLAIAIGLVLAVVCFDFDRRAPSVGGAGATRAPRPRAASEERVIQAAHSAAPTVRNAVAVEPEPRPELAGASAAGFHANFEAWRKSKDATLEGELVAARGIQDWHGWQIYIMCLAPPRTDLGGLGPANKSLQVDGLAGTFRMELPVGTAQVFWYHSVVGRGPTAEIDLEPGLNTLTLTYDGPDPRGAIFVDISTNEPVTANQITATRNATGQVFWAADFGKESRFVIPGLNAGAYTVRIERLGDTALETIAAPGERVRIDL